MNKNTKLVLLIVGFLILSGVVLFVIFQPLNTTYQPVEETQEEDEKTQNEWIDIAIAFEAAGELEKAIEAYIQAIVIQEVANIPWINLAVLYKNQGKYALARDAYENFIRIFPLSTQGYFNLAELYVIWKEGTLQDAIDILELGIQRTDDDGLKKELERLQQNL